MFRYTHNLHSNIDKSWTCQMQHTLFDMTALHIKQNSIDIKVL